MSIPRTYKEGKMPLFGKGKKSHPKADPSFLEYFVGASAGTAEDVKTKTENGSHCGLEFIQDSLKVYVKAGWLKQSGDVYTITPAGRHAYEVRRVELDAYWLEIRFQKDYPFILSLAYQRYVLGSPVSLCDLDAALLRYWRKRLTQDLTKGKTTKQIDDYILTTFRRPALKDVRKCVARGWIGTILGKDDTFIITPDGINIVKIYTNR